MALPSPRKAGLRAGKQMQVESAKSRLRGLPKSFVGNGFKPFPTMYAAATKAEGAVATNKEQLLARPRDGERAG
jgi:hypothetical protein